MPKCYQGEIDGKADIAKAFVTDMQSGVSVEERRARYPEMLLVWEQIFAAVRNANEGAEIHAAESFVQIW